MECTPLTCPNQGRTRDCFAIVSAMLMCANVFKCLPDIEWDDICNNALDVDDPWMGITEDLCGKKGLDFISLFLGFFYKGQNLGGCGMGTGRGFVKDTLENFNKNLQNKTFHLPGQLKKFPKISKRFTTLIQTPPPMYIREYILEDVPLVQEKFFPLLNLILYFLKRGMYVGCSIEPKIRANIGHVFSIVDYDESTFSFTCQDSAGTPVFILPLHAITEFGPSYRDGAVAWGLTKFTFVDSNPFPEDETDIRAIFHAYTTNFGQPIAEDLSKMLTHSLPEQPLAEDLSKMLPYTHSSLPPQLTYAGSFLKIKSLLPPPAYTFRKRKPRTYVKVQPLYVPVKKKSSTFKKSKYSKVSRLSFFKRSKKLK